MQSECGLCSLSQITKEYRVHVGVVVGKGVCRVASNSLYHLRYCPAHHVSELVDFRWEQFDLDKGRVHINRLKNGDPSVHFLEGNEIRALRKLRRDYPSGDFVFMSERQGPLSINAVHKIVARAGVEAGLEISAHPHMLRHGKGFELADRGIDARAIQGYLGHKNIQHTVRYTQLNASRFKGFGKDVEF